MVNWKKWSILLLFCLLFAGVFALPAFAEGELTGLVLSHHQKNLTDKNRSTSATVKAPLTVTSETPIATLYVVYHSQPVDFTLQAGETQVAVTGKFLQQTVNLTELFGAEQNQVTLTFSGDARLLDLYAFGAGELPQWVQVWNDPVDEADLCLFTTHADDEQLFFAGVLPYYAGEKGYKVQVIYFTDHKDAPLRRHELLEGLWTVGVSAYPIISPFPDQYSTTLGQAQNQLSRQGFGREKIEEFQVEMIRRFKPVVVIGHDFDGEYGHGQHRLNSSTLASALDRAADQASFSDSYEKYGLWDVPKAYFHLYSENEIVMDWDVPLEKFGGKTAFQVTQDGFQCHKSQHGTWFKTWLLGKKGEITKAADITTYSPCRYGLYRSTVGEDVAKNDFFENVRTHKEQRLYEEEQARIAISTEALTLLHDEVLSAQKIGSEAVTANTHAANEAERKNKEIRVLLIWGGLGVASLALGTVSVWLLWPKKNEE